MHSIVRLGAGWAIQSEDRGEAGSRRSLVRRTIARAIAKIASEANGGTELQK